LLTLGPFVVNILWRGDRENLAAESGEVFPVVTVGRQE